MNKQKDASNFIFHVGELNYFLWHLRQNTDTLYLCIHVWINMNRDSQKRFIYQITSHLEWRQRQQGKKTKKPGEPSPSPTIPSTSNLFITSPMAGFLIKTNGGWPREAEFEGVRGRLPGYRRAWGGLASGGPVRTGHWIFCMLPSSAYLHLWTHWGGGFGGSLL